MNAKIGKVAEVWQTVNMHKNCLFLKHVKRTSRYKVVYDFGSGTAEYGYTDFKQAEEQFIKLSKEI